MIVTCVYINVKESYLSRFIEATRENHFESVKEPGNLRFDVLQSDTDPCRFMLYEAYESEEAAVAHKSSPHYYKWRDAVAEMMQEPRKGDKYNILYPKEFKSSL